MSLITTIFFLIALIAGIAAFLKLNSRIPLLNRILIAVIISIALFLVLIFISAIIALIAIIIIVVFLLSLLAKGRRKLIK